MTDRSVIPVKLALATLACALVHFLAVAEPVTRSVYSARPRFTPVRLRPVAFAVPPPIPMKPVRPAPPISSSSTPTVVPVAAVPVLTVIVWFVRFSIPKLPSACRKPNTSSFKLPVARVRMPSEALSVSSVVVLGPVFTERTVLPVP